MPITPTASIWMNGELVAWEDATIHVLTHTLHYGTGVFEGVRAYKTVDGTAVETSLEALTFARQLSAEGGGVLVSEKIDIVLDVQLAKQA